MVTTGARLGTVVFFEVISAPLYQYSVLVPEAAPTRCHHRTIRRQLPQHFGHDLGRHSLGPTPDGRGRTLVAAQDAPRVNPTALVVDAAHRHAAGIGAVQAVQTHAGMPALDLGDHALKTLAVVDLAPERDLDHVADPDL